MAETRGYTAGAIIGYFFLSMLVPPVAIIVGIVGLAKEKKNALWVLIVGFLALPIAILIFAQLSALAPFIQAIF